MAFFGPFGARVTGLLRQGADISIAKALGSFTTFGEVTGFIVRNFGLGFAEASWLGSFVVAEFKAGRDLGTFQGPGAFALNRIPGTDIEFKGHDATARFQAGIEIQYFDKDEDRLRRMFWVIETDDMSNPQELFDSVWNQMRDLVDRSGGLRDFVRGAEDAPDLTGRIAFVKRRF